MSVEGHSRPSVDVRLQTTPVQKARSLLHSRPRVQMLRRVLKCRQPPLFAARTRSRRSLLSLPASHRLRRFLCPPGVRQGPGEPRGPARPGRPARDVPGGRRPRPSGARGRERTEECSRQRFPRRARVHRGPTIFECRHRKACWTARRLRAKARRAKPDRFGSTPSAARSHRAACP